MQMQWCHYAGTLQRLPPLGTSSAVLCDLKHSLRSVWNFEDYEGRMVSGDVGNQINAPPQAAVSKMDWTLVHDIKTMGSLIRPKGLERGMEQTYASRPLRFSILQMGQKRLSTSLATWRMEVFGQITPGELFSWCKLTRLSRMSVLLYQVMVTVGNVQYYILSSKVWVELWTLWQSSSRLVCWWWICVEEPLRLQTNP